MIGKLIPWHHLPFFCSLLMTAVYIMNYIEACLLGNVRVLISRVIHVRFGKTYISLGYDLKNP